MISGGLAGGAMTWYEVLEEVALNVAIGLGVCLLVLALCIGLVALIPAAASVLAVVLPIIACIGAFAAGWSIGTHIYNFIETGEVREFQEGMIELASFGLLIGIGSKLDSIFKTSSGTSTADDAMQAADDALKTADDAIQAADDAVKNGACFVAGTLISTHNGLIPIEKILAGDMVYSFNQDTEKVSLKVVEESFIRESSKLVHVTVGNEIITATPEHPFYVAQKGFKNAVDLRAGDVLLTVNGEYVVVEQIKHEILESPMKVYNFRVADNHTYFVGDTGVGVHNTANGCGSNTKGGNTTANDWNGKTGELAKQSPLKFPKMQKLVLKQKLDTSKYHIILFRL